MSGKFMKIKKIVIPVITAVILVSQMSGCAAVSSSDMVSMLEKGESITIEVPVPKYMAGVSVDKHTEDLDWVQLDKLKTHNQGFRQSFDEIFNINIVTQSGVNGKSGCLFVDEVSDRNGNTTLEDALRNKAFVTKYYSNAEVKSKLADIASKAYTDLNKNDKNALVGSINAYYNIMPDAEGSKEFKGNQSLTREQFYSMVYRSEEGVQFITNDAGFENATGGKTAYSKFAQGVDEYGFLNIQNKSLDAVSYKGSISRVEAVYMMVNKHFSKEMEKVKDRDKAFTDTKNAGDLAYKAGFKIKDKETKKIVPRDRWQSYTLAYMLQHPEKGLQEDLYKAMVVAKNLNLIEEKESRWDESISKGEALQLIINTHLAKNKIEGYKSEVEYGKINLDKFKEATAEKVAIGVEDGLKYGETWTEVDPSQVPADPNKVLSSGMTLGEAKKSIEHQIKVNEKMGITFDESKDLLQQLAKDMGTSLEEIARVPEDAPAKKGGTTTPAKDKSSNKTENKKPSTDNKKPSSGKTENKKSSSDKKTETKKPSSDKNSSKKPSSDKKTENKKPSKPSSKPSNDKKPSKPSKPSNDKKPSTPSKPNKPSNDNPFSGGMQNGGDWSTTYDPNADLTD